VKPNRHNKKEPLPEELEKLQVFLETPYARSADEIWETLQDKMSAEEKTVRVPSPYRSRWWLAAAVFALLLAFATLMRFYPHTVRTAPGAMASVTLPDGSSVMLNAQSKLTYYPFWWNFSPVIHLSGEAFFSGHHHRRFSVRSSLGTVTVLGTSFDVYARKDIYRVVCFSGKVNVTSRTRKSMVLTPGEKAEITAAGEITFSKKIAAPDYNAWTRRQFVFTDMSLPSVFNELARRYGVKIVLQKNITSDYTGNFSAALPIEEALSIVCKPFGLTFVKKDNGTFIVR
jgi:transmembrane sensor